MNLEDEASVRKLIQEAMTTVCEREENWVGDATALPAATPFEDLGLDSVATLELIGVVEDQIGAEFADDELVRIVTLGDLITLVQEGAA